MIINRYDQYKKDKTPYFSTIALIWVFNIIFSTHFTPVFFAGVVFMFLMESINKEYYYLLISCFVSFCFIETVHGLSSFSLSLIAIFVIVVLKPQLEHLFSSKVFAKFLYLFLFYFGFFFLTFLIAKDTQGIYLLFLVNFFIDSLLVGLLL